MIDAYTSLTKTQYIDLLSKESSQASGQEQLPAPDRQSPRQIESRQSSSPMPQVPESFVHDNDFANDDDFTS